MFINEAWAQSAAPFGADIMSMLPIILMFVVLYFVMIRPQMKRAKEHKTMVEALQKGDEVVAAGGTATDRVHDNKRRSRLVKNGINISNRSERCDTTLRKFLPHRSYGFSIV